MSTLNSRHINWEDIPRQQINAHNGIDKIEFARLFSSGDFKTNAHFVDFAVIPPGASIGGHTHYSSEELYFILSGVGEMNLNGAQIQVRKGDIVLNPLRGFHGLKNDGDTNIELLVIEIGQSKTPETHGL